MTEFFERNYRNETELLAALAEAETDNAICHRLLGGDRVETGARGIGPKGAAWLRAHGPPVTNRYTTPSVIPADPDNPLAGGVVRLVVTPEIESELRAESARPPIERRLTTQDRTRCATLVAGKVERARTDEGTTRAR